MTRQQDRDAPGVPREVASKPSAATPGTARSASVRSGMAEPQLAEPNTPGAAVGGGRYRLLERVGGDERVGASFWRARDSVLDRDVALTTLAGPSGARSVETALAAGRLEHAGIARILDVLGDPRQAGPGLTGLIVTEWIAGADLATLATDATRAGRILPTAMIARALSPLASAVDAAHRAGLALGVDNPQKIRIGSNGLARVAFPVASATGVNADDVRGLGAAIYLLLTGRWPLPNPPAGLMAAPSSAGGVALPAQSLRPSSSPTLAILAQRCLAGAAANGVYTGAAVHQLLEQVTNAEADTMLLAPLRSSGTADDGWSPGGRSAITGDDQDRARRRKLGIGLAVLGVALLLVFGWIGLQVASFFSGDPAAGGPTVVVSKPGSPASGQPGQPNPTQPAPAGPIQAAGIEVFDVTGDPDNQNRVSRAIDGNPRSSWKTYDYNQPFPKLKPGVGVLVSFAEPVTLAAIQVDSPSAGSTIEIRTAPAGDVGLAGTTVIGSATLADGRTEIAISQPAPNQRILFWITGLANRNGKNATEVGELTFVRAG